MIKSSDIIPGLRIRVRHRKNGEWSIGHPNWHADNNHRLKDQVMFTVWQDMTEMHQSATVGDGQEFIVVGSPRRLPQTSCRYVTLRAGADMYYTWLQCAMYDAEKVEVVQNP